MQIHCMAVAAFFLIQFKGKKLDLQNFQHTGKLHRDVALLLLANNREMKHAPKKKGPSI